MHACILVSYRYRKLFEILVLIWAISNKSLNGRSTQVIRMLTFYLYVDNTQFFCIQYSWVLIHENCECARVGTLIVATIYLQLIQNRYMFRSFTVFTVVTSIVYNPLSAMWKAQDTFSSACCVDSSNGAVYRLKNLWNSSEANATKWQRVVHNAGDYIEGQ